MGRVNGTLCPRYQKAYSSPPLGGYSSFVIDLPDHVWHVIVQRTPIRVLVRRRRKRSERNGGNGATRRRG